MLSTSLTWATKVTFELKIVWNWLKLLEASLNGIKHVMCAMDSSLNLATKVTFELMIVWNLLNLFEASLNGIRHVMLYVNSCCPHLLIGPQKWQSCWRSFEPRWSIFMLEWNETGYLCSHGFMLSISMNSATKVTIMLKIVWTWLKHFHAWMEWDRLPWIHVVHFFELGHVSGHHAHLLHTPTFWVHTIALEPSSLSDLFKSAYYWNRKVKSFWQDLSTEIIPSDTSKIDRWTLFKSTHKSQLQIKQLFRWIWLIRVIHILRS